MFPHFVWFFSILWSGVWKRTRQNFFLRKVPRVGITPLNSVSYQFFSFFFLLNNRPFPGFLVLMIYILICETLKKALSEKVNKTHRNFFFLSCPIIKFKRDLKGRGWGGGVIVKNMKRKSNLISSLINPTR